MDVNAIVDKILNFLSTTGMSLANTGFQIAMKQVIFEGIFWTLVAVFFLLFSITLFYCGVKFFKEDCFDGGMIASAIGFLSVFFFFVTLYTGLQNLIAPEYHTVLKIIELVK